MTDTPDAAPISGILRYRGKATRGQFWIGMLMLVLALIFAMMVFAPYFTTTGAGYGPISQLVVFVLLGVALWFHSAFHIARLRDRGRPIWWYLIYGFGPFFLYFIARMTQGNISNQPGAISVMADFGVLALIALALIDLGFIRGTGGRSAQGAPGKYP